MLHPLTTSVYVVLHVLQGHLLKVSLKEGNQNDDVMTHLFFPLQTLLQHTGREAVAAISTSHAAL